ncbi:hypothetical protein D3C87_2040570 [compost metagenome]
MGSAQTYQSARALVRFWRDSANQACLSEEWLITWSMITLRPSEWALCTRWSKSSSVPKLGSMPR